jgi:hypothetical protein
MGIDTLTGSSQTSFQDVRACAYKKEPLPPFDREKLKLVVLDFIL